MTGTDEEIGCEEVIGWDEVTGIDDEIGCEEVMGCEDVTGTEDEMGWDDVIGWDELTGTDDELGLRARERSAQRRIRGMMPILHSHVGDSEALAGCDGRVSGDGRDGRSQGRARGRRRRGKNLVARHRRAHSPCTGGDKRA